MDTQPILSLILEEARQTARKAESAAGERAQAIEKESAARAEAIRQRALEDAGKEASAAQDRARRLRELEDRKWALAARRRLIDSAFDRALAQLRQLPAEQMERLMLSLLVQNAAGNETLAAGDINGSFYTPAFIEKANQALIAAGREGSLRDAGSRAPGRCGLVLHSPQSSTYCTVDALLESGREELEQRAAAILFDNQVS